MSCDVGEVTERLENEQSSYIHTYSRAHSPTFPSLHLRHSSFSKPFVALPTSQFILQPFRCFTYVIAHSPTLLSLLLRHRLFTWRAAQAKKYDLSETQYDLYKRNIIKSIMYMDCTVFAFLSLRNVDHFSFLVGQHLSCQWVYSS